MPKIYFILLTVFLLCINDIQCLCCNRFVTFCDDYKDIAKYKSRDWAELIVGMDSNKSESDMYVLSPRNLLLTVFPKMTSLTIAGQIKDIESFTFYASPTFVTYQAIKLYNNYIRRIRTTTFDTLRLRTLGLVKNRINTIQKGAFYNCHIQTLDLSENELEVLEEHVLGDKHLGNHTLELILRHNEITRIENNALPTSLRILNLDHNKIQYLAPFIFKDLQNLTELTLTHNVITSIPDLSNKKWLTQLIVSHNRLSHIDRKFLANLTHLEVLDLSYNQIDKSYTLDKLSFRPKGLATQISLAFNRLTQLAVTNQTLSNIVLILYGNPWNCKCWEKIEKFLADNNLKKHKCDADFFGTGQTPYCLYFDEKVEKDCDERYFKSYLTDEDYQNFMKNIETNKKNIDCELAPTIYM